MHMYMHMHMLGHVYTSNECIVRAFHNRARTRVGGKSKKARVITAEKEGRN